MSLYHEAARFLEESDQTQGIVTGSYKSRVFAAKTLKSPPTQLYGLLVEATRWSAILSPTIEASGLLAAERKLTPSLALLLTHDLLVSKKGIALPKDHGLRQNVERHKARLSSALTRARIQAKVASIDQWRSLLAAADTQPIDGTGQRHPRWVRVNTLLASDDTAITSDCAKVDSIARVACAPATAQIYFADPHVANLYALPAGTDLTTSNAYRTGQIILQDKASCFPATLLNPTASDGDIIDACAAPGNKTTHLAALLSSANAAGARIFAVERDPKRAATLQKMVHTAGANTAGGGTVECLPKQDFLRLRPDEARFAKVGAILLDPSCSGSGIVGRDTSSGSSDPPLVLPQGPSRTSSTSSAKGKRKRELPASSVSKKQKPSTTVKEDDAEAEEEEEEAPLHAQNETDLATRLTKLANFQAQTITHAMAFPAARKIVYSTCSIHAAENEEVVCRVLSSRVGRERGWRVLRRDEQVQSLAAWERRGDLAAVQSFVGDGGQVDVEEVAQACIRCEKGTGEGTMGFFVAGFVRDHAPSPGHDGDDGEDDEFSGFED